MGQGELVSSLGLATDPHLFHPGSILDSTSCVCIWDNSSSPYIQTLSIATPLQAAASLCLLSGPKDVHTGGITANLSVMLKAQLVCTLVLNLILATEFWVK